MGVQTLQNDAARQIWELDRRHFLHPFTHFDSFRENGALFVDQGSGCEIKDANGQTYLDAIGGLWCTNIGLGREEMADAIADQVRRLAYSSTFTDMSNEPAALLAAKLAELAPGDLNRVYFSTGGSTAVDSAYRLVQFYQQCAGRPEKIHVIARRQAYHGSTYASMSIGYKAADRRHGFNFIEDTIHHISEPDIYRAPDGMNENRFCDFLVREFEDKIAEIGADKVGAFFAEPVMGAGGVLVPPEDYLRRMRDVCTRHDILYVSDEVVTAFGRLGHWFASEDVFGILPDIICSAKGLSSGYLPIGATIYSDRIHETISEGDPDRLYASGFTYAGHPVCCAAALKNIEIMEREDILAHSRAIGRYFGEQLRQLEGMKLVGDVRGAGLMRCVENVLNRETREAFPESVGIGERISRAAERLGLLVRPIGRLNIMSPPLVISREEVDIVVNRLSQAIEQVHNDLLKEGWHPV
ncbi:MAG: aminotransferase [Rhodobacteraceae bacterium]|nr:aminotransferase [Paracoccaceae bacterium]